MSAATAMELRAAIALCRLQAKACNVNRDDLWKLHSDDFVQEAREVLNAVGAQEMLAQLMRTTDYLQSACLVITDADTRRMALEQVRAARSAMGKCVRSMDAGEWLVAALCLIAVAAVWSAR